MSLVPFLLSDMLDDIRRPASLFDQKFGMGLHHDEMLNPSVMAPLRVGYYRPWRSLGPHQSGVSNIHCDKDGFKVNLDVQQFTPEELTVKVVDNNVIVEGKHEEREDEHGHVSRQFLRRYLLPKDVDPEAIQSHLSSDGVLTVAVPKKASPEGAKVKVVPITQTLKPAIKHTPGAITHTPGKGKKGGTEKMEA